MKIYFDVCCLNRPYDDQNQDRIHMESEAIITLLRHIEYSGWSLVGSGVLNDEINQTSDEERKARLFSLVQQASEFIPIDEKISTRAKQIQTFGIKTYDALHLACAEQSQVDVFLSTDDKLIKAVKRHSTEISINVENPLFWLQKVI